MQLYRKELDRLIEVALVEDIGPGDITSELIIPEHSVTGMFFVTREDIVICGFPVLEAICDKIVINGTKMVKEGDRIEAGTRIFKVAGNTRKILAMERTALNFVQRMSGIATITSKYVEAVKGTRAKILDTRKTVPGLRVLDKYAVHIGGGTNHRMGLYDAILIKDNHVAVAGGIKEAIKGAKISGKKIEVECDNIKQVEGALEAGADIILLDNMTLDMMREATTITANRALLEASGGVNLQNVRDIAETGVDYISVGAITHSVKAVDIGLDV